MHTSSALRAWKEEATPAQKLFERWRGWVRMRRQARLRLHWLDLIDELTINAELKRRRREWCAVERLQRWLRRRVLRTNWLRIVEEAKARRVLRALVLEQRQAEAQRRERATVAIQKRYRGYLRRIGGDKRNFWLSTRNSYQ